MLNNFIRNHPRSRWCLTFFFLFHLIVIRFIADCYYQKGVFIDEDTQKVVIFREYTEPKIILFPEYQLRQFAQGFFDLIDNWVLVVALDILWNLLFSFLWAYAVCWILFYIKQRFSS